MAGRMSGLWTGLIREYMGEYTTWHAVDDLEIDVLGG